jgi:hypothetical protein
MVATVLKVEEWNKEGKNQGFLFKKILNTEEEKILRKIYVLRNLQQVKSITYTSIWTRHLKIKETS